MSLAVVYYDFVVWTQTTTNKFGKKLNITLNNFKLLYIKVFRHFDKNLILAETFTFNPTILDYYNLLLLLLKLLLLLLLLLSLLLLLLLSRPV